MIFLVSQITSLVIYGCCLSISRFYCSSYCPCDVWRDLLLIYITYFTTYSIARVIFVRNVLFTYYLCLIANLIACVIHQMILQLFHIVFLLLILLPMRCFVETVAYLYHCLIVYLFVHVKFIETYCLSLPQERLKRRENKDQQYYLYFKTKVGKCQ